MAATIKKVEQRLRRASKILDEKTCIKDSEEAAKEMLEISKALEELISGQRNEKISKRDRCFKL